MNKILLRVASLSFFVALIFIASIWFWRPGTMYYTPNQGHRLGGDVISALPENTLEVFCRAIEELEANDAYHYTECDLRETSDHQISLFHDWDLARLVPDTQENRDAVGVEKIDSTVVFKNLTQQQIKSIKMRAGCQIPSLEEFFQCAAKLKPAKPILLELKLFHSEEACSRVIELASEFRNETGLEVQFLAFIRNIKRSHPRPRQWLDEFKSAGFRVYQAYRPKTAGYDLCETW